jgi:hypothetical protein
MRQSVSDRDGRGTFLQTPISYQGDFTVKLLQIFLAEQSSIAGQILKAHDCGSGKSREASTP